MEPLEVSGRRGIKIERPPVEEISAIYYVLLAASLILVLFTASLLILEWTGTPLPASLRQLVSS